MIKPLKRISLLFSILASVMLVFSSSSALVALSNDQVNLLDSEIYWYDIDDLACGTPGGDFVSSGNPGNVYLLGDSIAEGARNQITSKFSTPWNITINAQASRGVQTAVEIINGTDSEIIKDSNYVVVELGANNQGQNISNHITEVVAAVKAINNTAQVYWVDVASSNTDFSVVNEAIHSTSGSDSHVVVPWFKAVFPNSNPTNIPSGVVDANDYIADDAYDVHPTAEGSVVLADTIFNTILATNPTQDSSSGTGVKVMPQSVPEPYRTIFANAAAAYDTDALGLTTQFLLEHALTFPEPPPPYGTGGPWDTSYANAQGPFQFLTASWNSWGVDGDNDGDKDVQDLVDAAYGAANLMKNWFGVDSNAPLGSPNPAEGDVFTKGTLVFSWAAYRNGPNNLLNNKDLGGAGPRVQNGYDTYLTLSGGASVATGNSLICEGGSPGTVGVSPDGFVFPIAGKPKSAISWCGSSLGNCHGKAWGNSIDYYAYDIWSGGRDSQLVAVRDGVVYSEGSKQCTASDGVAKAQRSIWLLGDDNVFYFYQHMDLYNDPVNKGDRVTAGQPVGVVGPDALVGATCSDTSSHLHFAAMSYTTGKKSMYRGCTQSSCPNMDKLLDIAEILRASRDALPD